MINITKQYRTRNGREVRIYATDGKYPFVVQGAVKTEHGEWEQVSWTNTGNFMLVNGCHKDLVEVPKRIKQTVYLNIYDDSYNNYVSVRYSKENALDKAEDGLFACVKVDIDVEEGHGLT